MTGKNNYSLVAFKVKKSTPGHTSMMTVALSFNFESLPENIVFFVIVNRRRGTTEGERRGSPKHWTVRLFK